ncbi:MAG: alpha/beta hydrolase [Alphaproteobacteria bacterium]
MANATVYFATNRKPNDPDNPTDFTTDPVGVNDLIRFGQASFTDDDLAPENDAESDAVLSALGTTAQIVVAQEAISPQDGSQTAIAGKPPFAQLLASTGAKQADALVCIHGYDYTFRESVARAAQLQNWYAQGPYGKPLLVILLAWPSLGQPISTATYTEERQRSRIAGPAMGRALMETVARVKGAVGVERVHLLAHSMGNWALRWAVQSMEEYEGGNIPPLFEQILLAAADEDSDALSQHDKLQPVLNAGRRITVYCNMYDWALTASDWIEGNPPRLGAGGPDNLQALPPGKVTAISVAAAADPIADSEQHQYYRSNDFVRRDLMQVIAGVGDSDIAGRSRLQYHGLYVLTGGPGA